LIPSQLNFGVRQTDELLSPAHAVARRTVRRVLLAATLVLSTITSTPGFSQTLDRGPDGLPAAVRSLLLAGIQVDFARLLVRPGTRQKENAAEFGEYFATSSIGLESTFDTTAWRAPNLRVWVAFPAGVDHWHRYSVAEVRGGAFAAGGFAAPELIPLSNSLGSAGGIETQRAALLAALADPNGGERLLVTDTNRVTVSTGSTVVQLKTVSHQSHAFGPYWTAFRYAFLFTEDGKLLAWSRVEERLDGP
jgi:hypothetical protein